MEVLARLYKQILNKTFGLRDGEIYISFLMQLYIFLIITVLLIVKPTVNALFISKLGANHLPYGYILVAGVAVFTSYYYNKAIRAFSLVTVTTISLIIFSLSFIVLACVLQFNILNNGVLYLYYLGVSLFAVIATSQFWILANIVFNTREAKRLFGFIGAGAIAGGVFGGYLTSVVVSVFGTTYAILLAAIFILICIPILKRIWTLRIRKLNSYIRTQRKYNEEGQEASILKVVCKSRHLTYLSLIMGLAVIIAKLVDFQFSDFAYKAIPDPDELASFFGFWFSSFNLTALGLQLFLTNRFLSKLGVSTTLLVLPCGIVLASLLFFVFPELWVLVILKGIDGSFKQSLNKAAVELSIMPIPFHIKNQAKSFIDVAVDSIATGIAGLLLVFVVKKLNLATASITGIVLILTVVWIVLIFRLRDAYFDSFRINIQRNLSAKPTGKSHKNLETNLEYAKNVLKTGTEEEILAILIRLSHYRIVALKPELLEMLKHPSSKVKESVIKQLYVYDKGTAIEEVKLLVFDQDLELVNTALEYILQHSYLTKRSFFKNYLDHDNINISNAALLSLSKEALGNEQLALKYNLIERITDKIKKTEELGVFAKKEDIAVLLITIAYSGLTKYYNCISLYFNSRNAYVTKHAIKAAGITADERFIEPLLEHLSKKVFRKKAIVALKSYGPQMMQTIIKMDKKEDLKPDVKRFLPRVIQSYNTQTAVKVLMLLLNSKDVIIRFEASKALHKLKSKNQKLNFNSRVLRKEIIKECKYAKETLNIMASIHDIINASQQLESTVSYNNNLSNEILKARQSIIHVLEEQLDMSIKSVFKLLGLLYNEADIQVSYSGLVSDAKEARIYALEFLDNLLQSQIKAQLLPIVEYYVVDKSNDNESGIRFKMYSEKRYITRLLKKRGRRMKLEVLNLINVLNNKSFIGLVLLLKNHKNMDIQNLAEATEIKLRNFNKF